MKKTILAALVILLAVLAVTCDSALDADKEPLQYTEDGRPLIPLTINAPKMIRALTADLAKGLVDYYEVAFKDPSFNGTTNTKIYRTSWNYSRTGRIAVPSGDYTGAAKAVLFAGRYNDKTLYAVGIITSTSEGAFTEIKPTTTSVTFTLSPLLNDVSTVVADSTFMITGPSASVPDNHDYMSASLSVIPKVELTGSKWYPIFYLPPAGYINTGNAGEDITATYKVNCGTSANANYAGVIVAATDAPIISAGYSDDQTEDLFTTVAGKVTSPVLDAPVPATGIFNLLIDISAAAKNGLSRLSVDIPVCAINTQYNLPGVWHIRGGMNQTVLDEGKDADAPIGGAILLAVGPVKVNGITINKVGP
jgi:hypothetical protein